MAIVGLLVAVPVTLLVRDGDDDGDPSAPSQQVTTGSAQAPPAVGPGADDRGLDVSYRVPEGWKEAKKASALRLTSPDSAAEIVVAAPAPAADADQVLDQALSAFESEYEDVDIAPGSGRKVGGLDAKGAVVTAARGDEELRVLVAVAAGEQRTYLVEVFTTASVSADGLRQAQAALNSLKLRG